MLPIVWRASARDDLQAVVRYIANESPAVARRMKGLFEASVLPTSDHPYMYRASEHVPGLREIIAHPNYRILYRATATHIEVVSIVHTRREFPPQSEI